MHLYGCGILGVQASRCTTLQIWRTEIYECSQGAGQFFQTDGISFTDCDIHDVPSPAFVFTECGDKTWNGKPFSGLDGMYDIDANGDLVEFEYTYKEDTDFHGAVEDLDNPFAAEPAFILGADTPQVAFAGYVQQAIANDDWEALADRIVFPVQVFTTNYSFTIHDREEYMQKARDGYFVNELFTDTFRFRDRIADADTSVFASCVFGNTCLDHLIAFTCPGNEITSDNLMISAISVVTPFWPGRDPSADTVSEAQP